MHILLVKTSSLGDVVHNLPVASDIRRHFPDARIDWAVEESFAEIPRLHPAVTTVSRGGATTLAQGAAGSCNAPGDRCVAHPAGRWGL